MSAALLSDYYFWRLSPLFIILAIKLESPGPAIIKLERVSQGRVIKVYKFRSMIKDAQKLKPTLASLNERRDGSFFKIKNDPELQKQDGCSENSGLTNSPN